MGDWVAWIGMAIVLLLLGLSLGAAIVMTLATWLDRS